MLLSHLSHAIRQSIYGEYLGTHSMSIAMLRQTCKDVRFEIDNIPEYSRYGNVGLMFTKQVSVEKLHGCRIVDIESAVCRIEPQNIDAYHWDALFANAVQSGHLEDVGRLLDTYVYPTSVIFPCTCAFPYTMGTNSSEPRLCHIDSFAKLVSKCDAETIQNYCGRLFCDCARQRFLCGAIRQSLYGVLDACAKSLNHLCRNSTFFGMGDIARAVGASGDVGTKNYIVAKVKMMDHLSFYSRCFNEAASKNHVALMKSIDNIDFPQGTTHRSALHSAIISDSIDAIRYLQNSLSPSSFWTWLLSAATVGNSSFFQEVLALRSDPLSKEWHTKFARDVEADKSLSCAFNRSDDDFCFFLNLYMTNFASVLLVTSDNLGTSRVRDYKILAYILTWSKKQITPSRMTLLLQSMCQYFVAKKRELHLDALHYLLQQHPFRVDVANVLIGPLLSCLSWRSLSHEEAVEMTRLALTDEAYDWVTQHFGVNVTAKDASEFLYKLPNWPTATSLKMRKNYFRRCLFLGATFKPGLNLGMDVLSISMGIPYKPPAVGRVRIMATYILSNCLFDVVQKFLDGVDQNMLDSGSWREALKKQCLAANNASFVRSASTGCFKKELAWSTLTAGNTRLYHYVCESSGVAPIDLRSIPNLVYD